TRSKRDWSSDVCSSDLGADKAVANQDVIVAIRNSDAVIVAPANPVSSIGPIIALADLRQELVQNREKVIAVSPLIGGKAINGPEIGRASCREREVVGTV